MYHDQLGLWSLKPRTFLADNFRDSTRTKLDFELVLEKPTEMIWMSCFLLQII